MTELTNILGKSYDNTDFQNFLRKTYDEVTTNLGKTKEDLRKNLGKS